MIKDGECFIISGSKDLIFRMEHDQTLVYDPYDLLTYRLNGIAAEMMYFVYLKYDVKSFIDYFSQKYSADESAILDTMRDFLEHSLFTRAIIPNIIEWGLYK